MRQAGKRRTVHRPGLTYLAVAAHAARSPALTDAAGQLKMYDDKPIQAHRV